MLDVTKQTFAQAKQTMKNLIEKYDLVFEAPPEEEWVYNDEIEKGCIVATEPAVNEQLKKGDTIKIFNYGNCKRDFTYINDIVEGVVRVMQGAPERKNGEDGLPVPPYAVYNIGNQNPENLLDFVDILQQELIAAGVLPNDYDFEAHKQLVPMQPGDVPVTYADTTPLKRDYGYKPSTELRTGLRNFARWYKDFYKI